MAKLTAFTELVPDDHAPEVLLDYTPRVNARLKPEQGPGLVCGAVTMDNATFTIHFPLPIGDSATSQFSCRTLLDTGLSQSSIHQ